MVNIRKATVCDHIRFVISAILLLFSLIVTSYAIVMKQTSFFDAVPGWVALILFFIDLFLLGIVEGLQIALVELKRQHPDAYKVTHPAAYRLGLIAGRGDNVERFLMGRQVSVVILVFFAAKLTTIHANDTDGKFLFPVPGWYQAAFLETGFLSCIVVVILAQLMPQIVAAKYPVHFLQYIIMKPAYYFCIFIEMTGLTHICWCLATLMEKASGMEDDLTTVNPMEHVIEGETASETLQRVSTDLDFLNDTSSDEPEPPLGDNSGQEVKLSVSDKVTHGQLSRFSAMIDTINRSVTPDMLLVIRHFLDNHPEMFAQFPSVIGNKMYPAPQALAEQIAEDGYPVPKFLTDISDPEHVPPHIVACKLMSENQRLRDEVKFLKTKLEHV